VPLQAQALPTQQTTVLCPQLNGSRALQNVPEKLRQNLEFLRHKFYNPLIFSEFLCDRTPGVIRDTLDPGDELDFPFLRDLFVRWRPALRQKVDGARWQKGQKFRKGAELVKALERPSMRVFPIAAEIPVNLLRALTSYPAVASRKTGQRAQSFSATGASSDANPMCLPAPVRAAQWPQAILSSHLSLPAGGLINRAQVP